MNSEAPVTITISNSHPEVHDDDRWQFEDAPCFPRPLCVSVPPKRPDRQASVGTGLKSVSDDSCCNKKPSTTKSNNNHHQSHAMPAPNTRRPPARITRPHNTSSPKLVMSRESLLPPQRPMRQKSAAVPSVPEELDSVVSSSSSSSSEAFSRSDSERSLELDSIANHKNTSPMMDSSSRRDNHNSSRDLSPLPPTRQKTGGTATSVMMNMMMMKEVDDDDVNYIFSSSSQPAAVRQPSWVKLWESQGEQDGLVPRNG